MHRFPFRAGYADVEMQRTMIDALFTTGTPIRGLTPGVDQSLADAGIGLWQCDLATEKLSWSQGVWDLFALERGEEPLRTAAIAHYDAASRAELEAVRSAAIRAGKGFRLDTTIIDGRGQLRRMRITAAFDASGTAARLHGTKRELRDGE